MKKITFEINGKEYELPTIMNINDYVKIFKIKDLFEDEYLDAKVINLITGCPMDDLLDAENHKIKFLSSEIFKMIPVPPYKLIDRFELNGIHYGYIPSYKEMSFAEFADLDTMVTKKPEEIIDYYHIITAIMYRPIISEKSEHNFKIEKYNSDTMIERAELFKEKLDIKYSLGGIFFFIKFVNNSSSYIHLSLKQKMQREWIILKFLIKNWKMIWRYLLRKDSDGMSSLIELQITHLQNTIKSSKKM